MISYYAVVVIVALVTGYWFGRAARGLEVEALRDRADQNRDLWLRSETGALRRLEDQDRQFRLFLAAVIEATGPVKLNALHQTVADPRNLVVIHEPEGLVRIQKVEPGEGARVEDPEQTKIWRGDGSIIFMDPRFGVRVQEPEDET